MKSTKFKRTVCIIMSIVMLMTMLVFSVFAADEDITECEHNYVYGTIVPSACTYTGTEGLYCTKCGSAKRDTLIEIPMLEHVYKLTSVKDATATEDGYELYKCENCDAERKVDVPAAGCVHSNDGWADTVEWTMFKAPACTEVGKEEAYCNVCKRYIVRDIPATGHTEAEIKGYPAKCTEYGKTQGKYCTVCFDVTEAQNLIKPKGHDIVTKHISLACCESSGQDLLTCSECDYIEFVKLEKLPHVDDNMDGFCDSCDVRMCDCLCHKGNFLSNLIRMIDTLLNNIFNNGENVFHCCPCMEPYQF